MEHIPRSFILLKATILNKINSRPKYRSLNYEIFAQALDRTEFKKAL